MKPRPAVVLIIVLIVIVVISLSAYTFSDLMISEHQSVMLSGRQLQARQLVHSGQAVVESYLLMSEATRIEAGGHFNNEDLFRAIMVTTDIDPALNGNCSMVAPALDDEGNPAGVRFGLQDESSRLNLNTLLISETQQAGAGLALLLALPGMTEDTAAAIMDWIDEDDDPRDLGAESEYYSSIQPPYGPKNGPLDTVEELLLVRGVTPQLLFGLDTNRNGMLEQYEVQPTTSSEEPGAEATTALGWSAYLTLHSAESGLNSQGESRIDLNSENLEQLYKDLSAVFDNSWATFIVAYRQNGAYSGSDEGKTGVRGEIDYSRPATTTLTQVLDLIGKKVQVQLDGDDETTVIRSPFEDSIIAMNFYLPILLDQATINPADTIPGRLNINHAPRELLLGVPGMTEEIADKIIDARPAEPSEENPNLRFETWIMTEGLVTLSEMRALQPFICAGGDIYRAQIVGYFEGGTASSRAEVIWDATSRVPRILSWRDMSHLGRGYALDTLGVRFVEEE